MSHSSSYPSPPYSQPEYMDATRSLYASAWHVLEQPHPPTLRDILHAYKSKGDGDREMLLAMLNAKSAEDQRIAAIATLHQKLCEVHVLPRSLHPDFVSPNDDSLRHSSTYHPDPASPAPQMPTSSSSSDVTLPSIHVPRSPRKRARTLRSSSPPLKRRHTVQESESQTADQLPPSPLTSSPGRTTHCPELAVHYQPRDAMAIGSLLSYAGQHQQDADSDWPSRTSSERDTECHRRQAKISV